MSHSHRHVTIRKQMASPISVSKKSLLVSLASAPSRHYRHDSKYRNRQHLYQAS